MRPSLPVRLDDSNTGADIYTVHLADWQDNDWALRAIREAVFIREQGVPAELEWDEFDADCVHLIARDAARNAIGTARLLLQGARGAVGRMAVLKEWRRKGVGGALLRRIIEEARRREVQQLTLNAQTHAVGFYARFGFRATGDTFMDAGLPHIGMILPLGDRPR